VVLLASHYLFALAFQNLLNSVPALRFKFNYSILGSTSIACFIGTYIAVCQYLFSCLSLNYLLGPSTLPAATLRLTLYGCIFLSAVLNWILLSSSRQLLASNVAQDTLGYKGAGAQPFDHVSTGPCFNFARIGQWITCPRPEPRYPNIRLSFLTLSKDMSVISCDKGRQSCQVEVFPRLDI
jgi:hypothetical protein